MTTTLSRRDWLRWAGAGAATLAIPAAPALIAQDTKAGGEDFPFSLPKLPYAVDALEPHIDAKTMEIHHNRHHKAYVDNLNKALMPHKELQGKSLGAILGHLDQVPADVRGAVRNNGGGHFNHRLFWQMMAKKGGGEPKGAVKKAIDESFGSFDKFQDAFSKAAMARFGSGWAWLVFQKDKLAVVSTANQDTPVMGGVVGVPQGIPILALDVWEHAYYLKYQNMRAAYVKAWWNVVNWTEVAERLAKATR